MTMSEQSSPHFATSAQDIERRASTRYPCSLATSCRLMATFGSPPHPARVRNLSAGGISLVLPEPVDPGKVVTIQLTSKPRNVTRTLQVRVIYCVDHPSGEALLGGSFVSDLPEDELRAFLA